MAIRTQSNNLSLIHALTSSPYATARALQQLADEEKHHEFRPDELRYALGTLEHDQLLSDLPPTIGRLVHTLLTTESRISQCELADRANVSARTIRNYRDRLEALDLIRVDERGYRLALSFRTTAESRNPFVPTFLEDGQTLLDATDALLDTLLPPDRYGDPDDPLGSALFWPSDPSRLLEHPTVAPWLRIATALTATESAEDNRAVRMGPSLEQQALSHARTVGSSRLNLTFRSNQLFIR